MTLGERLLEILDGLPAAWADATLVVGVESEEDADRAALVLGPLSPGRLGRSFRITVSSSGLDGPSVDAVRRAFDRLESEGIDARLTLPGTAAFRVQPAAATSAPAGLAASWNDVTGALPEDWSDLYLEVALGSSDEIERAALLCSPVNPFLVESSGRPVLRFRAARRSGYGAAPMMVGRCLARLDDEHIAGELRVLRVHSETRHVLTQGPVWRDDGRAV